MNLMTALILGLSAPAANTTGAALNSYTAQLSGASPYNQFSYSGWAGHTCPRLGPCVCVHGVSPYSPAFGGPPAGPCYYRYPCYGRGTYCYDYTRCGAVWHGRSAYAGVVQSGGGVYYANRRAVPASAPVVRAASVVLDEVDAQTVAGTEIWTVTSK